MPDVRRGRKVSLASNASDGLITNFTPFSSDQMIRNLSMKIGEVDSARLLATHSNLAEPESTSPIFMLEFLIIWSAAITRLGCRLGKVRLG